MRILLIGDASSSHMIKWALSLRQRGYTIGVFSTLPATAALTDCKDIVIFESKGFTHRKTATYILRYLFFFLFTDEVKKAIASFKPDVVHAHYASSFGMLGARSGFHPFVLSVWGSDVYSFPLRNIIWRRFLQYTLKKADAILSTSHDMARQTNLFTAKKIGITPFGVNTNTFAPRAKTPSNEVVFGIIKTMDDLYGLPTILQAFKQIVDQHPNKHFRLRIVGTGPQLEEYKTMSATLGIHSKVDFVGRVDHSLIADEHHKIDIYLNPSQRESFGVSVVEAMACGKSVIVTDVGGLPEVVDYGDCGIIVPVNDANALADAMLHLADHPDLRQSLGEKGRTFVLANYDWERNVTTMEELAYRKFDKK